MIWTCAAFFSGGISWAPVGVENSRLPIIAAIANLKSILFDNGFVLCRPTAYSPEVALAPECKPDPPGRTIYQLTTTVWIGDRSDSKSLRGAPNH